jgi:hypothetical protein
MNTKQENLILELVSFWNGKRLPEWFGLDPKNMTKEQKIEYDKTQEALKEFDKQWKLKYETSRK